MNPDSFCTSDQWSMLSSASANSQLAGVLGGFLILVNGCAALVTADDGRTGHCHGVEVLGMAMPVP